MRTAISALSQWHSFEQYHTLNDLGAALHNIDGTQKSVENVTANRSACWKAFLAQHTLDLSTWPAQLQDQRTQYEKLRENYLVSAREDETDSFSDPLSEGINPHETTTQQDQTLKDQIHQDVERCMPENLYFRQPGTRTLLVGILLIWSKLNREVSYRQGMHELLAPIVWAVERDAVDSTSISAVPADARDSIALTVFDAAYIEHDSYTLFQRLMLSLKSAYAARSSRSKWHEYSTSVGAEPEIVDRAQRIMIQHLAAIDPELASHLMYLDLQPQLFIMPWIRLLFGRAFEFDKTMVLWDCIFAEKADAEIIDRTCLAMILRQRWQLLNSDQNNAFSILLHYPALPTSHGPASLIEDARLLRRQLSEENANVILHRRTGRGFPITRHPSGQSNLTLKQRAEDSTRGAQNAPSMLTPPRIGHQSSNSFEVVLQNAARSVYSSGERLGVSKAVRDAVGDVRKNVQSIGSNIRNRSHSRNQSSSSEFTESQESPVSSQTRLASLRKRNKSLAHMLEDAVNELWKQHQETHNPNAGQADGRQKQMENLTMAIAKVQLVQVYLSDSELPLPDDETPTPSQDTSTSPRNEVLFSATTPVDTPQHQDFSQLTDNLASSPPQASPGAEFEETRFTSAKRPAEPGVKSDESTPQTIEDVPHGSEDSVRENGSNEQTQQSRPPREAEAGVSRPSLEQSSFSWMLGLDSEGSDSKSQAPFLNTRNGRGLAKRGKGQQTNAFLFGDADAES